jgi:hypothetical protein
MVQFGIPDCPSLSALEPSCPTGDLHSYNDRLLCSRLHGQNIQLVLTILSGIVSVMETTVRTIPRMVDKVDTSLVEAQRA